MVMQATGGPNSPSTYIQTFLGTGTTQWYPFMIPSGARMVHLLAVGGGGSGSGGFVAAASTAAPGGGGGGSGGIASLLIPATFLPQIIYLQPGAGGAGVLSSTGNNGGTSFVSIMPRSTNAGELILQSETVSAKGGVAPSAGATGVGGAGGTIATIGLGYNSQAGIWQAYAGVAGKNGGTAAGGAGVAVTPATFVTGGAGGGSSSTTTAFAGGAVSASGNLLGLAGGTAGAGAGGGNGQAGSDVVSVDIPSELLSLMLYGGSGGGSERGTSLTGGKGGDGAPGCGSGGGGGSSGTTAIAGPTGNGGPGFIRIMCW